MRILSLFQIPKPIEPLKDQAIIQKVYKMWRWRVLIAMFLGYATFYLVRKNLNASSADIQSAFGFTNAQFGAIFSAWSIVYGFGKFGNGILADRANLRYVMVIGLVLSAFTNILFGLSSSIVLFAVFWTLNGYFQALGWPPCARGLTQWYSKKERGTFWGICNASHQVGGSMILVLASLITTHYGWRMTFFIPAAIAILVSIFLFFNLRDNPQSLGLPSIEQYKGDEYTQLEEENDLKDQKSSWELLKEVFKNKEVWLISIANVFVYVVRWGILNWTIIYLVSAKSYTKIEASSYLAGFEVWGLVGAFLAGWLSDKFFYKNRGPLNALYMFLLTLSLVLFWKNPLDSKILEAIALFSAGFFVYGPQMLVGVCAADTVRKSQAATATGMTGLFGYVFGATFSGIGAGWIVDNYGWDGGFIFFISCAVIGMLLFLFFKPSHK